MTRVLSLFGGWPGHTPYASSAWADDLYDELATRSSARATSSPWTAI